MTERDLFPNLDLEFALYAGGVRFIAGIDEAGRGALAGPVVAAAVILPLNQPNLTQSLTSVHDSKQLSPTERQQALENVHQVALGYAVGSANNREIDELGLMRATRLSMRRALAKLPFQPDHLLLDYILLPEDERPQTSMARADSKSLSVAAASIIAKVTRDQQMIEWEMEYPGYGFSQHKGYGTSKHRQALEHLGPTPLHRLSYAPVAAVLA
jgi:ribonuclease HII